MIVANDDINPRIRIWPRVMARLLIKSPFFAVIHSELFLFKGRDSAMTGSFVDAVVEAPAHVMMCVVGG